jgi:hypothetical protein
MHNLHGPNLYSTRYGTVLCCTCCGRIQITFHGYVLLMDEAEFERFQTAVGRAHDRAQGGGRRAVRGTFRPIPTGGP